MAGVPLLSELMPWSVPGLRVGRGWVRSAHPEVLAARWRRLAEAEPPQRAELFRPSRSRTVDSAVPQLPGQATSTRRLSQEPGTAPEPVRLRHGAFDRQWLLADQRLLDQPRPELGPGPGGPVVGDLGLLVELGPDPVADELADDAVTVLLGVFLDRWWGTSPIALLIGTVLGFILGMMEILRIAREGAAADSKRRQRS